jgi:hypothetical protein
MKNLSEIRQELSSVLRQTEEFRKEKLSAFNKGVIYTSITVGAGALLLLIGLTSMNIILIIVGGILMLCAIAVYAYTAANHAREFKEKFKSTVLKQMVESIIPGISYGHDQFINQSEFNTSQLFSNNANVYKGEDYFAGTISGTSFKMSELTVQKTTKSTSYSNGKTTTKTSTHSIFKGIFIIMELPKNAYGETYVLPDSAEKMLGSFGKFIQKNLGSMFQKGAMIYLEDHPEFEKDFVVYSTEEIESKKLLTPSLLQSILEIYTKWKIRPSLAFVYNKVYVAIPTTKNLFKVNMRKSLIDDQQEILQGYLDEIALCINVIEEIADI